MENYASDDLDTSSKTPLYLGIAAIILGLAGLALGWVGFAKAGELETRLAELEGAAGDLAALETRLDEGNARRERLSETVNGPSREVSRALRQVENDVSSIKTDVRRVTIQAGTALNKVEEFEKQGVQAAPPPSPSQASSAPGSGSPGKGDSSAASNADGETYRIQIGDTFARLAARFGVSIDALLDANPGVDPRRLRVGQEVVIPKSP